jgi:type II secretory ATPase GspE/PulE/Tfp pilus assembly ATPase PilB-like protein
MSSGVEHIDLSKVEFTRELLQSIPKHLASKYRVLPVSVDSDCLCVAAVDPFDSATLDSLTHLLKCQIQFRAIDETQFDTFYRRLYVDSGADADRKWHSEIG